MASRSTPNQSGKETKDLACLVAALQSSRTQLDVDYDEFIKLDGAPTKHAAQMRLYRLGKSLGVELTSRSGGCKVTKGPATPKIARKRKSYTAKSALDKEGEPEGDELAESHSKKMKAEKILLEMMTLEEEAEGQNGDRVDGEKE